jgi:hypothetical protein
LQGPDYKGWENSTIYYNRQNSEYSLDLGTGDQVKNYRFDRDGNPVVQSPNDDQ